MHFTWRSDPRSRCETEWKFAEAVKLEGSGHNQLHIYANFVEPHWIGDGKNQLLRSLTRKNEEGTNLLKEMSVMRPMYVPVKQMEIEQVEIKIEDEHDHLVPFAEGKTVLNLDFRPVKPI